MEDVCQDLSTKKHRLALKLQVHDSFWSHAADIPVLNEEIRARGTQMTENRYLSALLR